MGHIAWLPVMHVQSSVVVVAHKSAGGIIMPSACVNRHAMANRPSIRRHTDSTTIEGYQLAWKRLRLTCGSNASHNTTNPTTSVDVR